MFGSLPEIPGISEALPRAMSASPRGRGKGGRGGTSARAPPKEMQAKGNSVSWTSAQANHIKVFDKFLEYIAEHDEALSVRWGKAFAEVPEAEACANEIWGHLATFLAEVYIIPPGQVNAGQHYNASSAQGAWSNLLQLTKLRFNNKAELASTRVRAFA